MLKGVTNNSDDRLLDFSTRNELNNIDVLMTIARRSAFARLRHQAEYPFGFPFLLLVVVAAAEVAVDAKPKLLLDSHSQAGLLSSLRLRYYVRGRFLLGL